MKHEQIRKEEKFIKVFEENIGIVVKIAKAYTNTTHDREDLTNDIVVELWRSFDTFKGHSSVSTWIYRSRITAALYIGIRQLPRMMPAKQQFNSTTTADAVSLVSAPKP